MHSVVAVGFKYFVKIVVELGVVLATVVVQSCLLVAQYGIGFRQLDEELFVVGFFFGFVLVRVEQNGLLAVRLFYFALCGGCGDVEYCVEVARRRFWRSIGGRCGEENTEQQADATVHVYEDKMQLTVRPEVHNTILDVATHF